MGVWTLTRFSLVSAATGKERTTTCSPTYSRPGTELGEGGEGQRNPGYQSHRCRERQEEPNSP